MRRTKRTLFNLFAFSLLSFSIYLNFFYKGDIPGLLKSQPPVEKASKHSLDIAAKPKLSLKK